MKGWIIRPYRRPDGSCPIQEFLDELDKSAHDVYVKVVAQVRMVADNPTARQRPLFARIEGDLWEVRVKMQGVRVFVLCGTSGTGDTMVVLDGVRKKTDDLRPEDIQRCQRYASDYKERCVGNEHEQEDQWPLRPSKRTR